MQTSLSPCPCSCSAAPVPLRRRGRLQTARVNATLAVPSPRGPARSSEASTSQPALLSWGANAASMLRLWPGSQQTQSEAQQVQKAIQEASRQQATKAGRERAAPDVGRFLNSSSDHELRQVRLLASLTGLTYYMGTLTPRSLRRRHGLELVYTSLACELTAFEPSKTAEESLADGDGMAVSLADARSMYAARNAAEAQRLAGASNIVMFPSKTKGSLAAQPLALKPRLQHPQQQQQQQEAGQRSPPASPSKRVPAAAGGAAAPATAGSAGSGNDSSSANSNGNSNAVGWNPADLVAAKLSEAAALASSAAFQPLASAAGSLYSSGVGFVSSALSQQLPVDRLAAVAIAGVAGAESATGPSNPNEVKAASTSSCPSEWFVADDATSHTRYFVIQGSDSLDHWKCNLMFDPVAFEDAAMGVMVHRGVYEAVQTLYERFLPLVQEYTESSPFARVCFTGHSIGGSMATLLALLFKKRGVLSASQLAPCYTFGAPAVFCEGGACCSSCAANATPASPSNRSQWPLNPKPCSVDRQAYHGVQVAGGGGLLAACGLKEDAVRNVIMHRDIVPRAFACDYTAVADILRSWGPGFKEHRCLARDGRKHLYFFVGQMMVLQPDADLAFTNGEPYHPMLPPAGGLFVLSEPTLASTMAAMRDARRAGSSSMVMTVSNAASNTTTASSNSSSGSSMKEVASVSEVVWELMDNPHPLDILGDPGAYLATGSISRYHNPDNYKRALGRVLAKRRDAAADVLAGPSAVPGAARKQRAFFPVVSAANAGPARGGVAGIAAAAELQAA